MYTHSAFMKDGNRIYSRVESTQQHLYLKLIRCKAGNISFQVMTVFSRFFKFPGTFSRLITPEFSLQKKEHPEFLM